MHDSISQVSPVFSVSGQLTNSPHRQTVDNKGKILLMLWDVHRLCAILHKVQLQNSLTPHGGSRRKSRHCSLLASLQGTLHLASTAETALARGLNANDNILFCQTAPTKHLLALKPHRHKPPEGRCRNTLAVC